MGGMGWMPDDFYRQEMNTTLTALAGYLKRRSDDERIQRRTAVMISSPWMDKGFDPYKWWPIAGDDNTKISRQKSERDRRLARLRELKELDAKNKLLGN